MAQFESALNFIIPNEGGFSDDAADPGGVTNHGISLRFLKGLDESVLKKAKIFGPADAETIRALTPEQAGNLYRLCFWEAAPFPKIINQKLANYIFDMAINHGLAQAVKLTQRAICACQKTRDYVIDDGVLGPKTLAGINQASFMLMPALIAERESFVRFLVQRNPELRRFLDGWLNRSYRI